MARKLIIIGLTGSIITSVAGFPFEARDAHDWAGFLFVMFGILLFLAAMLLFLDTIQSSAAIAAIGFFSIALYGFGTTINGSLLARGELDLSVHIQPGIWGILALGLILLGISGMVGRWISLFSIISGIGHLIAASALLFGAEMPHTGAEATDWAPLTLAISKLFFWGVVVGLILYARHHLPDTSEQTA